MSRPSPSAARLARASAACQRCRRRKQKCDLKYPQCSNCEGAQATCLTYDVGKQAEVPRNYVSHLEAQVRQLSDELRALREQSQGSSRPLHSADERIDRDSTPTLQTAAADPEFPEVQDLVTSVRDVVVEPSDQPRFLGASSGITLARMVMASINADTLPHLSGPLVHKDAASGAVSTLGSQPESSLPPRQAANHLVDVYFQYRTPHLPIIQEAQAHQAIEHAYADHGPGACASDRHLFTTYMIFAIALCNIPSPTGGTGRPLQSEGCFRAAIHRIEAVIAYSKSDIETLRAVLLLAQFVSMCPWRGSLWHLAGIALRLCVDLGLHWEVDEQALSLEPEVLSERRRLWHSAYHLDRLLGITLGRPFAIPETSSRVPLPNPWAAWGQSSDLSGSNGHATHHQRAHNHIFTLDLLESEIKHVQQSHVWPSKLAYPRPNYKSWSQDIQPRLQEWISTVPEIAKAHPSSIFASQPFWDTLFYNALLLLHRPNPANQLPSSHSLSISFDAACKLVASIKLLQRDGRLDILWKAVYDLFIAGLTVIYCVWQPGSTEPSDSVGNVISTLQSCASTLSAMSVNFSGAVGCRDAFDTLSTATIGWLVTNDVEKSIQGRELFNQQVGTVWDQMQLQRDQVGVVSDGEPRGSGANDLSSMLSADNYLFGEILSTAAQWPNLGDIDFDLLGIDDFAGAGMQMAGHGL